MTRQTAAQSIQAKSGLYPSVRREKYAHSLFLTLDEEKALAELLSSRYRWGNQTEEGSIRLQNTLRRLMMPLRDALAAVEGILNSRPTYASSWPRGEPKNTSQRGLFGQVMLSAVAKLLVKSQRVIFAIKREWRSSVRLPETAILLGFDIQCGRNLRLRS